MNQPTVRCGCFPSRVPDGPSEITSKKEIAEIHPYARSDRDSEVVQESRSTEMGAGTFGFGTGHPDVARVYECGKLHPVVDVLASLKVSFYSDVPPDTLLVISALPRSKSQSTPAPEAVRTADIELFLEGDCSPGNGR